MGIFFVFLFLFPILPDMTFFAATKRLLSPIKDDPIAFAQNITEAVFMGAYTIFSIEVTKILLKNIESGDAKSFYLLIKIYIAISIILMLSRFLIRSW